MTYAVEKCFFFVLVLASVLQAGWSAILYVKYIQADRPTQIIQRVRSSVRSIVDLDLQHQNQGMCIYGTLVIQLQELTLCLQLLKLIAVAYVWSSSYLSLSMHWFFP